MRFQMGIALLAVMAVMATACDGGLPPISQYDSGQPPDTVFVPPIDSFVKQDLLAPVDLSVDATVDSGMPPADMTVDLLSMDATVDSISPDATVDSVSPDATVDSVSPDATVDLTASDAHVDSTSDAFNPGVHGWYVQSSLPVLKLGMIGSFDQTYLSEPYVMWDVNHYKMWYIGGNGDTSEVGLATSPDGMVWTKEPTNPVLKLGPMNSWDDRGINSVSVLKTATGYDMWYSGRGNMTSRPIGHATSPDGITWTKYVGNPIFISGTVGAWDENLDGCYVLHTGVTYHMWYTAMEKANSIRRIGYASSSDGLSWTKEPNAVLPLGAPGKWDDVYATWPTVLQEADGSFAMWYFGSGGSPVDSGIGWATSSDGKNWVKEPTPVLLGDTPGQWDAYMIGRPAVIRESSSQLRMWYVGALGISPTGAQIGYATHP